MGNQLQKVIDFIKKTGDKVIIFDQKNLSDAYVVVSLEEYERKILSNSGVRGLTEDELLDKINRDIAVWKSQSSGFVSESDNDSAVLVDQESLEDDMYYRESGSAGPFIASASANRSRFSRPSGWRIPKKIKRGAEAVE